MAITLDNEYRSFEALIENGITTPTLRVLPKSPVEPIDNDVVFTLENASSEEDNRAIVSKSRTYQLLFYTADRFEAMQLHSKVEALFSETASISCVDRHIKLKSPAMSRIFTTESGKEAFICMIEGEYRVGRTFTQSPLMTGINARITD